jgi:hypothetical protein
LTWRSGGSRSGSPRRFLRGYARAAGEKPRIRRVGPQIRNGGATRGVETDGFECGQPRVDRATPARRAPTAHLGPTKGVRTRRCSILPDQTTQPPGKTMNEYGKELPDTFGYCAAAVVRQRRTAAGRHQPHSRSIGPKSGRQRRPRAKRRCVKVLVLEFNLLVPLSTPDDPHA